MFPVPPTEELLAGPVPGIPQEPPPPDPPGPPFVIGPISGPLAPH